MLLVLSSTQSSVVSPVLFCSPLQTALFSCFLFHWSIALCRPSHRPRTFHRNRADNRSRKNLCSRCRYAIDTNPVHISYRSYTLLRSCRHLRYTNAHVHVSDQIKINQGKSLHCASSTLRSPPACHCHNCQDRRPHLRTFRFQFRVFSIRASILSTILQR